MDKDMGLTVLSRVRYELCFNIPLLEDLLKIGVLGGGLIAGVLTFLVCGVSFLSRDGSSLYRIGRSESKRAIFDAKEWSRFLIRLTTSLTKRNLISDSMTQKSATVSSKQSGRNSIKSIRSLPPTIGLTVTDKGV